MITPRWILLLTFTAAALVGCDDSPEADPGDAAADSATDTQADAAEEVEEAEPVELIFDLDAELTGVDGFFDLPYPSDARLTESGGPALDAFGNPLNNSLFQGLLDASVLGEGFPVIPVAWFQFTGPVAEMSLETTLPASTDSPVLLIDVDPDSDTRGKLLPTIAHSLTPDTYTPANLLGVASHPGVVLEPNHTYAFVVRAQLGDASGEPLQIAPGLAALAAGETPEGRHGAATAEAYAPLWPTLDTLGVPREEIAAAAVFTTGDVVSELYALSEAVRADYDPAIENLALETTFDRYCQLHGDITLPQFQKGDPPFNTEGLFEFDESGGLIEQRSETIPVVITVPRQPMPEEGYPLVMYYHGSGGISTQLVDRGPRTTAGGAPAQGEGPAYVVAEHGFGMAGSAHPVNPERVPGASAIEYLNLSNPKALRDTFRQGVIEQRLYLDALLELRIDPALLEGCDGPSLPDGATAYAFDPEPILAMGQSMGGMYTNMIGAVEPRIQAVAPTGAGGFWSYFILVTELLDGKGSLQLVLGARDLTHLHPAMHIIQTTYEPSEPMIYMPRLARDPLPDHPVRSIYEPLGRGDSYFPTELFDAIVVAYGHPLAGDEVWDTMQPSLAQVGLDGFIDYPVADNLTGGPDDTPYTGVAVQYEGDGIDDPHVIFVQLEEVRYQYGCFFHTFYQTGTATVPAPADLGTPCPGLP